METLEQIKTGEEIIESLQWRYATKKFDPSKKLAEDQVNTLLGTLELSASSMGLQPYRFIHVRDRDVREELRIHSYDQSQITDSSELIVFAAKATLSAEDIEELVRREGEMRGYDETSIHKRIASVSNYVKQKDPEEFLAWTSRQLYISMGKLLEAAALMRIDACPMEGIKGSEYDRILGLEPLNLRAFAVVTLGFRSDSDAYAGKPKVRLPREQIIKTI